MSNVTFLLLVRLEILKKYHKGRDNYNFFGMARQMSRGRCVCPDMFQKWPVIFFLYVDSTSNPGHLEVLQRYNAVLVALTHITEQNSSVDIIAFQFTAKPDERLVIAIIISLPSIKGCFRYLSLRCFFTTRTRAFTVSSIKITCA